MNRFNPILLVLVLFSFISLGQINEAFYLQNTLEVSKLSYTEKKLLDSTLHLYHKSKIDTIKIKILSELIKKTKNQSIYGVYNNIQIKIIENKLFQKNTNLKEKNTLKGLLANALGNKGNLYAMIGKNDSSIIIYNQCIQLYKEVNSKENIHDAYNSLGAVFLKNGDFQSALKIYTISLTEQKKTKEKKWLGTTLQSIGQLYYFQGKMVKALEYLQQSIISLQEENNIEGMAISYSLIGNIFHSQNDIEKTLEYYHKAFSFSEKLGDEGLMGEMLAQIANVYLGQNKNEEALKLLLKSYNYSQKSINPILSGYILGQIANAFNGLKKHKESIKYSLKSLEIRKTLGDKIGEANTLSEISMSYYNLGDIDNSLAYAKKSYDLSEKIKPVITTKTSSSLLKNIYAKKKDWHNAYLMLEIYTRINDSISNKEKEKEIYQKQLKFEYQNKEALLKAEQSKKMAVAAEENKIKQLQLNQSRYLSIGLGLVLIFGIAIAFLIIQQNKLKSQQHSTQLEQKLLRSQMNPHFIFNALNAIESFIYKNEAKEAGKYLSKFAGLMRLILENSREEYVSLEKEIQTLELYLNLQKLRYDNSFSYKIKIDDKIDISSISIPPMLAQPFIENSIEHGLKNLNRTGELILTFSLTNNELIFETKDNGIGFANSSKNKSSNHKSLATTITLERLENLNRNKSKKITWLMEDVMDSKETVIGARVVFTLPYT